MHRGTGPPQRQPASRTTWPAFRTSSPAAVMRRPAASLPGQGPLLQLVPQGSLARSTFSGGFGLVKSRGRGEGYWPCACRHRPAPAARGGPRSWRAARRTPSARCQWARSSKPTASSAARKPPQCPGRQTSPVREGQGSAAGREGQGSAAGGGQQVYSHPESRWERESGSSPRSRAPAL